MRIDKKLHLVIPIYEGEGEQAPIRAYVHASAISSEIFDRYFLPISKTFAAIYNEGLGEIAGPRVADKILKLVSEQLKVWDGESGVKQGLVAEMHRLATVLIPGNQGWEPVPLYDAKKRELIDSGDIADIEAAICFFTVGSHMLVRALKQVKLEFAANLWGARISSQDCTEFLRFLKTSTAAASSGATATA